MNGFEDKRNLRALNVQLDWNSGSPNSREPQGDGASIVLRPCGIEVSASNEASPEQRDESSILFTLVRE
jgi:hypothetical protein